MVDAFANAKISVGPPFYNLTFVPIMIPLLIVMAVGPMLKWKRDTVWTGFSKLRVAATLAGLAILSVAALTWGRHVFAALGLGLAVWVVAGSIAVIAHRVRLGRAPLATVAKLARTTPRAVYGLVLAHLGVGIAVAGITAMSAWQEERIEAIPMSGHVEVGGYRIALKATSRHNGPNYEAERATFDVTYDGAPVTQLFSERRFYPVRRFQTTEAGIHTNLITNVYVAVGSSDSNGHLTVRAYYHPLAPWIWFGPMIMALGGLVSLSDRRLRVGAPQRARRRPALVPAE